MIDFVIVLIGTVLIFAFLVGLIVIMAKRKTNTVASSPAVTSKTSKTTKTSKVKKGGIGDFLWKIFWGIVALMIFVVLAFYTYDTIMCHLFNKGQGTNRTPKSGNTAIAQRIAVTDTSEISSLTTPCIYFSNDSTLVYSSGPVFLKYKGVNKSEKVYSPGGQVKVENLPRRKSSSVRVITASSKQEKVIVKRIKTYYRYI